MNGKIKGGEFDNLHFMQINEDFIEEKFFDEDEEAGDNGMRGEV